MKKTIVIVSCVALALFLVWAGVYYYNRVYIPGQNTVEWSQDIEEDISDDEIHWWTYEHADGYRLAHTVSRDVYENLNFMVTIEIKCFDDGRIEARFAQEEAYGTQIVLRDGESDNEVIFTGSYDELLNGERAVLIDNPDEFVAFLHQYPNCVASYTLVGNGTQISYGLELQHGERLKDIAEW